MDLRSGLGSPRLRLRSGPGTSKAPPIFLFHPSKEPGRPRFQFAVPRNSRTLKRDASRFCRRRSLAGMSGRPAVRESSSCLGSQNLNEVSGAECVKNSIAAKSFFSACSSFMIMESSLELGSSKRNLLKFVCN